MPAADFDATPTRPRVPNAQRSSRTRRGIQKAAVECFHRQGYSGTTVDDIVKKAGVTKGAFYHHFKSKDEVLARVQEDLLNALLDSFDQIANSDDRASDKLTALIAALARTVLTNQAAVTVWSREHDNLKPIHRTALLVLRNQLDSIIADTIAAGVESGEFNEIGNTRLIASGIIGMTTWLQSFSPRDGLNAEDIAAVYASLLLGGLRND